MDKHDILIVSKSDDNSIYVTTKGDIFEIAAAIKAITGGIVHHTMENRGVSSPAFHQPSPEKLLVVFAALISYCTGSLTCGLARSLALATATLCHGILQSLAC